MKSSLVEVEPIDELATYAYSYPHKSSYEPFAAPIPLREIWQSEDQSRLALYLHLPFCEMRCGFCNLLTLSQPDGDAVSTYLAALLRQITVVREELSAAAFRNLAFGGGTPTFLAAAQLEWLLKQVEANFGVSPQETPTSIETSPATATADRLQILKDWGVERISLGVQSFVDSETGGLGRPQNCADVHAALDRIKKLEFPILNVDLIYGAPEQSPDSWRRSLAAALEYVPQELFLYPLYVRPQTGLARIGREFAHHRVELFRAARDILLDAGYEQMSLRFFRKPRRSEKNDYCCQRDGMIGLGCGARSYTQNLHYSSQFAVTQTGIRALLGDWVKQTAADFSVATYGVRLDEEEQRRRFVILSILQTTGLNSVDYRARFGASAIEDLPELAELIDRGWIETEGEIYRLTESGLENSDVVGALLYSTAVLNRLREFVQL